MKETLINFETAKLAKEKGFDLEVEKYWCNYYTGEPYNKWKLLPKEGLSLNWMEYPAPQQSLLQKWLREKHNKKVSVDSSTNNGKGEWVDWYVSVNQRIIIDHRNGLDSYEEALEVGLLEALKLI